MEDNGKIRNSVLPELTSGLAASESERIIRSWIAIEAFSAPLVIEKDKDLIQGWNNARIVGIDFMLPWQHGRAGIFYILYLGFLPQQAFFEKMRECFQSEDREYPISKGNAPLAAIILDSSGKPVDNPLPAIGSQAWAGAKVISGEMEALGSWPREEIELQRGLLECLQSDEGELRVLNRKLITEARSWLIHELGIDPSLILSKDVIVEVDVSRNRSNEAPDPPILKSFFIPGLVSALDSLNAGTLPTIAQRYLGMIQPSEQSDILEDHVALSETLRPMRFPAGRWPAQGRWPLALMQQAAVNESFALAEGEVCAVNGPPGTGKTTLLRDVVAGLVCARAEALARFDDPQLAFVKSSTQYQVNQIRIAPFSVDASLRGFEMLVASANNKAVENISKEFPLRPTIDGAYAKWGYFKPLGDALSEGDSWGAIAGVLGNSKNRSDFAKRFWWEEKTSIKPYLDSILGKASTEARSTSLLYSECDPPLNHVEALRRWNTSRKAFISLKDKLASIKADREALYAKMSRLMEFIKAFESACSFYSERPRVFSGGFTLNKYRAWKKKQKSLFSIIKTLRDDPNSSLMPRIKVTTKSLGWKRGWSKFNITRIRRIIVDHSNRLNQEASDLGIIPLNDAFWGKTHDERHISAPWFNDAENRLRDDLFISAMDVHKTFIDAAASPLSVNLSLAMDLMRGKTLREGNGAVSEINQHVWSSLFLVIPVLSTTFASLGIMLHSLPLSSLGWLLIDEAGQASPQFALEGFMKFKHAIVVGDPIQIPPVVTLPETLTKAIALTYNINHARFIAPAASVQTLADEAMHLNGSIEGQFGPRKVGIPLLVHRRCYEPMFSISNRIAYGSQMVLARPSKESSIRDILGQSRWIDIESSASDKYSPTEGHKALELAESYVMVKNCLPDMFFITPFRQVMIQLRALFGTSATLLCACDGDATKFQSWLNSRIGTVHTVQGREAEAVVFILGAPNANQNGARNWAGSPPNLLNVAVTRAKEVIYVIGNKEHWEKSGAFYHMAILLEKAEKKV